MDENVIKNYIEKLEEFEKTLSQNEDEVDDAYIQQIESVLNNLATDAAEFVGSETQTQTPSSGGLRCRIKKLHENAIIPSYSKDGDAGLDLTATEIKYEDDEQITYGTGIALEIPYGYVGLVYPRSSIRKYTLQLSNSVGVIDSGYRGEIMATFNKIHDKSRSYGVGERICQIIIIPYPKITLEQVDNLTDTERGDGGFGSTGV